MRSATRSMTLLTLIGLTAAVASAWEGPAAPDDVRYVVAGGESLTLWPYTTPDLASPSDPVNLIFPNADPRAIREALMRLDGVRPPFAAVPGSNCRWTDAMGSEHAAWAEREGWVGGAIQLACIQPGAPFGSPFRFHIRLFRSGDNTIGGAHFEFLIPGTAEHEVLSWDLARELVAFDVGRTGVLTAAPSLLGLVRGGTFRAVRRPVYLGLVDAGALGLLRSLGLLLPASGDAPIPTSGQARVLEGAFRYRARASQKTTATRVTYSIIVPKPFCATGPYDFVQLEGPLDFSMTVRTDRFGRYDRAYLIGGHLEVTPMQPTSPTTFEPTGAPSVDALVFEVHRGTLTNRSGQVTERGTQILLGDPRQSLIWRLGAGRADYYAQRALCGTD